MNANGILKKNKTYSELKVTVEDWNKNVNVNKKKNT